MHDSSGVAPGGSAAAAPPGAMHFTTSLTSFDHGGYSDPDVRGGPAVIVMKCSHRTAPSAWHAFHCLSQTAFHKKGRS